MPARALTWGLIGAGDIARKRVAPALRDSPLCDLLAISRARPELAESFAAEFGAPRWYPRWEELLAEQAIEAVYVATPVHLHAAQTVAAAEAGKHVLCEKPMAMDVRECDRMIAACRTNHVRLGIAYYRRFYPVIARVRHILDSAEIGAPVLIQMNAFESFNPQPGAPRHWLVQRSFARGGPMFDFGCHRLEILVHLFGQTRRTTSLIAHVAFDREVEDTAAVLLQFASGACATLAVTHAALEARDTFDVFGTRGSIHIAQLATGDLTIRTGTEERFESHPPAANVHQPLIEDFAAAVLANREPTVDGEAGRAVAAIEDEIYGSF